jgi:hypothetical protein
MYSITSDPGSCSHISVFRMSLQSAIIGFLISKLLAIPITPQETVVIQSTAVATGTVCQLMNVASDIF